MDDERKAADAGRRVVDPRQRARPRRSRRLATRRKAHRGTGPRRAFSRCDGDPDAAWL